MVSGKRCEGFEAKAVRGGPKKARKKVFGSVQLKSEEKKLRLGGK